MKRTQNTVLAILLALLLCMAQVAQARSLLSDRLEQAFDAGRTIEASISLDLDDSLAMLGLLPEETFAMAQDFLRSVVLSVSVTQPAENQMEAGFALRIGDAPILDGRAWTEGDKFAATTSLLPGKTLILDAVEISQGYQESIEQITGQLGDLQGLGESAANYLFIIFEWMENTENLVTTSQEETPATPWRNASVESHTLRVTPEQLKGLLMALAEALSQDAALMQALSMTGFPLEEIEQLVPTENAAEWTFYVDGDGEITGVTGTIPAMFGDGEAQARFSYDRLTEEGVLRHRIGADFKEPGAGSTAITLETESDLTIPEAPRGSVGLQFHQADAGSTTQLSLLHAYGRTLAPDRETLESQTMLDLQNHLDMTDAGDSMDALLASMAAAANFSAALDFASDTRAKGQDDFRCESALGLNIMGMQLGRMLMTLESSAHIPANTAGNITIDMASLDEAGLEALYEELQAGLMQALMGAMAEIPPELMMMFQ